MKYGLGTFNSKVVDHGWIYVNYGHGFVDPLTGIVLWLGVAIVGLGLIRRRREDEGALLMLGGFLVLWLSFAFARQQGAELHAAARSRCRSSRISSSRPCAGSTNRWRSVRFARRN